MDYEGRFSAKSAERAWVVDATTVLIPYHATAAHKLVGVTHKALQAAGFPQSSFGTLSFSGKRPIPDGSAVGDLYSSTPFTKQSLAGGGHWQPGDNTQQFLQRAAAASPTKSGTQLDFGDTPAPKHGAEDKASQKKKSEKAAEGMPPPPPPTPREMEQHIESSKNNARSRAAATAFLAKGRTLFPLIRSALLQRVEGEDGPLRPTNRTSRAPSSTKRQAPSRSNCVVSRFCGSTRPGPAVRLARPAR